MTADVIRLRARRIRGGQSHRAGDVIRVWARKRRLGLFNGVLSSFDRAGVLHVPLTLYFNSIGFRLSTIR